MRRSLAALAVPCLIAACGGDDGGGPSPLRLTATLGAVGQPTVSDGAAGTPPVVRCDLPITLAATGAGTARLLGGRVEWYTGSSRVNPTRSATIPAEDVARVFAPGTIASGGSLAGTWPVQDSVAFTVQLAFDWRPEEGGPTQQVGARVSCGPAYDEATLPPAISGVAIEATGDLKPRDSVTVRFTVTAAQGLWRTRVRLAGACQVQADATTERFEVGTVTRARRIALPDSCVLGVPLVAEVTAVDAALRETISAPTTGPTLVDREAPTFTVTNGDLPGRFVFGGDTIPFLLEASDDVGLAHLVVEALPSGTRDSVALPDVRTFRNFAGFVAPSDWQGATQLRLTLVDRGRNRSTPVLMPADKWRFRPSVSRPTVSTRLPLDIAQVAVDRRGNVLAVHSRFGRVVVYARATLAPLARFDFPVDGAPIAAGMTPSGDSAVLLFENRREVRVVDLRPATPVLGPAIAITGLDAASGERPWDVVVTATGRPLLSVGTGRFARHRLVELDLATGTATPRTDTAVDAFNGAPVFVRSGDGRTLYLGVGSACTRRWTLATDTFGPCAPVGLSWNVVSAADLTGSTIVDWMHVRDGALATARPLDYFTTASSSLPARLSPDGATVYLGRGGGAGAAAAIVRARAGDGVTLDLVRGTPNLNLSSFDRLELSPDGRVAVLATTSGLADSQLVLIELP